MYVLQRDSKRPYRSRSTLKGVFHPRGPLSLQQGRTPNGPSKTVGPALAGPGAQALEGACAFRVFFFFFHGNAATAGWLTCILSFTLSNYHWVFRT